jgi:Holliday junction resolvasome RuvABC endonuclease subunit
MIIISFDLSTVACGYAVFENEKLMESGTIKAKKDSDKLGKRLSVLKSGIEKVLVLPPGKKIDCIVSEKPLFFGGKNKPFSLGAIHGLLKMICYENELPEVKEIDNKKWKKHIASGGASKEKTKDFLERVRGIKTKTFDESDAIGIAIGWIAEEKYKTTIGKYEAKMPLPKKRSKKMNKVTMKKSFASTCLFKPKKDKEI